MEYASSVWDPTNRKKIGNLEKVQKRAARFVFNNYTDRTPGCVTKMVESLIKAIFASSPAVVGLDILVAVYIN
jgi:hypothetical protein